MNKNINPNQLLLIGIATALFVLTAVSFYLLQDPTAPLPFTGTLPDNTATPPPASLTYTAISTSTPLPTRQTSYTPFASIGTPTPLATPPTDQPTVLAPSPQTSPQTPTNTASPLPPTSTATLQPGVTPTFTNTSNPAASATATFTPTSTLNPGQYLVTGRLVQKTTPVANAVVQFTDDNPARQGPTNSGGHYFFTTLAPGTYFYLQFRLKDNQNLTPTQEIASITWLEGNLPTGPNTFDLPDLEIGLNLNGVLFSPQTPVDGATYSATFINPNNPLSFTWTIYNQGEAYFVELGPNGSDLPIYVSEDITTTSIMWDGTLDDDTHITQGAYWWRVGVRKTIGNYKQVAYTPNMDLLFNP